MRDMAQYTKIAPSGRIERLLIFNRRLRQSPDSSKQLKDWDLELDPELIKIPARILPYPDIVFGNNRKYALNYIFFHLINGLRKHIFLGKKSINVCYLFCFRAATNNRADWTNEFRNNSMAHCIELKRWYLITPSRCKKEAEDFVKALQRAGSGMRFNIVNPRL